MDRDRLAALGIQLPVLPTIVIGGLPGSPDWAPRLERIGLDVVSSGAAPDTDETFADASEAVPHRPCKATGRIAAARLVELSDAAPPPDDVVVVDTTQCVMVTPKLVLDDANQMAAYVLDVVRADPSRWWVAGAGLKTLAPQDVELLLTELVEAVRHVRLFLAKQQFDPD